MPSDTKGSPARWPLARTSFFYFWLMTTTAVATPFLSLWLEARGLEPAQIGIVNAAPLIVVIFLTLAVGRVADLSPDWRRTLVIGSAVTVVTPLLFLGPELAAWQTLSWIAVLLPMSLVIPAADAASARLCRRLGRSYASVRLWGTVGHVSVTLAGGVIVAAFGIGAFVPLLIGIAAFRLAGALMLPPMPAAKTPSTGNADLSIFREPWFLLPVIGHALINGAHMMQNGFGAIYWAEGGLDEGQMGVLWAAAALSEIVLMAIFPPLARRVPVRTLLALAGVAGALRWLGLAFDPGFATTVALQVLHMFSFGLSFLAMTSFVVNRTDDGVGARAQGIVAISRQALAAAALLLFGAVAQTFGAQTYFLAAAMSLLGAGLCLLSLRLRSHSLQDYDA